MIIGIGTDLVAIKRIEDILYRMGSSFRNKIFTPREQEQANTRPNSQQVAFYAKRFAAKEATAKALGTGIGSSAGWQDIEILSQPSGAPTLHLSGKALETAQKLAQKKGKTPNASNLQIHLSLADDTFAQAFVVIEST